MVWFHPCSCALPQLDHARSAPPMLGCLIIGWFLYSFSPRLHVVFYNPLKELLAAAVVLSLKQMQKQRQAESRAIVNALSANLAWSNCRQADICCVCSWRTLWWYWMHNKLFPSSAYNTYVRLLLERVSVSWLHRILSNVGYFLVKINTLGLLSKQK